MLVHQLIERGEDERIFFRGDSDISYQQFRREVARYRGYLHQAGVHSGENVGLLARNSPAFVYAYMAIVGLGAVVVPVNYQLTPQEVAFIIKDARIQHLIVRTAIDLAEPLLTAGGLTAVTQHCIAQIEAFAADPAASPHLTTVDEDQPCAIIYTSGTTGSPKGAVLTHRNLVSDAVCFSKAMPLSATDNIICILPLYHCLAWTCIILCALLHKAAVTVLDTIVPKDVIAAVDRFNVTVMYGVPAVYILLLKTAAAGDLSGIRLFVSGGASLPRQVAEDFQRKFGTGITEGYGLSEAAPVVAVNPPQRAKYLSIGKPIPGIEVRIAGPQGEAQAAGKVGELIVRGPNVMQGYFNLPDATARALRDGWLYTGDLAYQDEEGYLFIVDRLKDLIITSGENIYPREIEELLYHCPGVSEAAVIGLPDSLRGQVVCAYLVMKDGCPFDKKMLKSYLRDKLAAYKLPREYIQVDHLPKNQSGKIMKRLLREQHG